QTARNGCNGGAEASYRAAVSAEEAIDGGTPRTHVQKAASICGFEKVKDMRNAMVAMVFIGGLASVETRKRLFEREELTSKEVWETAEAVERVGKNAPHLKQGVTELRVAAIAPRKPRLPSRGPEAEVEL
ncbi:unnamed protein product, partial [Haemonchus placei]|uniref:OHCU_decarbox domain-containing protein n=1 Tax=Haemonchus placei TaxID=6290 RepID=A0A0N4WZ24_HAEPC